MECCIIQSQDDEVEVAMKQVNELLGGLDTTAPPDTSTNKTPWDRPVLTVDRRYLLDSVVIAIDLIIRHLNALNEMKRIFGSRVVRGEQRYIMLHRVTSLHNYSRRRDHKHSHHKQTM